MEEWQVTEEAIQNMQYLAKVLEEIQVNIQKEYDKLFLTAEENEDGLGAHASDILEMLDEMKVINNMAFAATTKLSLKIMKSAVIRQAHIDRNSYQNVGGMVGDFLKNKGKSLSGKSEKNYSNAEIWPSKEKQLDLKSDLKATNPNYFLGWEWQNNCQRCVPSYEMRCRGYDVTAKPRPKGEDHLAHYPFDAWKNPEVYSCRDDGFDDIETLMKQWGDGARAQIVVAWSKYDGHTFFAEQKNGETIFYDPQNGSTNVSHYFLNAVLGSVKICRIDNLEPTDWIMECCERRK